MKTATISLEYQPYFEPPPQARKDSYRQACSNDGSTIDHWKETWVSQIKANHAKYGPWKDRGIGKLWGRHQFLPAVVVGSGPSLRLNAHLIKDLDPRIPVISCLHNFHYFVDNGLRCDYWVNLDSGPVTLEEVSEGGSKTPEEYFEATKHAKLCTFVGAYPKLLDVWRGEMFFYACPIPDGEIMQIQEELEPFHTYVSTGGNVLGACCYIAKAILGCNPIAFLGADFSFSNRAEHCDKFHPWNSKYDKSLGQFMKVRDVYGNLVKTWPSYYNFKHFFDFMVQSVPGLWVNCTEGGTFGATNDGNIRQLTQMDFQDFINMVQINKNVRAQCDDPQCGERKVLY